MTDSLDSVLSVVLGSGIAYNFLGYLVDWLKQCAKEFRQLFCFFLLRRLLLDANQNDEKGLHQ